jgi:hypothetical protein
LKLANTVGEVFELVNNGGGSYTPTELGFFGESIGYNFMEAGLGGFPSSGLIADAAGDLFGTTYLGTVFEIVKTGTGYAAPPTTLVSFNGTDGWGPYAGLIADAASDLFGTTESGGAYTAGSLNNEGYGMRSPTWCLPFAPWLVLLKLTRVVMADICVSRGLSRTRDVRPARRRSA